MCARGVLAVLRCFDTTSDLTPSRPRCSAVVAPEGPAPTMTTGKSMNGRVRQFAAKEHQSRRRRMGRESRQKKMRSTGQLTAAQLEQKTIFLDSRESQALDTTSPATGRLTRQEGS